MVRLPAIGDGFPLTELLPPTALVFPRCERRELYAGKGGSVISRVGQQKSVAACSQYR